jgi:hypothetical protein
MSCGMPPLIAGAEIALFATKRKTPRPPKTFLAARITSLLLVGHTPRDESKAVDEHRSGRRLTFVSCELGR